jgi:hypothetical protein
MKVSPKSAKTRSVADQGPELESEVIVATEAPVEEDTKGAELVPFALTVDLSPPPKVGPYDLLKMMSISVLKKGVHKIPRTVAEVLQDKGYGSML